MTVNSIYYASINGRPVSEGHSLPLDHRALWYGDGVFETMAIREGILLKPQLHLDRLRIHADRAAIEVPWDDDFLLKEMTSAVMSINPENAVLRLMIFREGGLSLQEDGTTGRLMLITNAPQIPDAIYKTGIKIKSKAIFPSNQPSRKSLNWSDTIIELRRISAHGYHDLLWHQAEQGILEASAANIFLLGRHGDLVEIATPPINDQIIAGTTRQVLINLLNSAKIPVTIRPIAIEELPRFDEAFLTSTIKGIVPIAFIDKKQFYTTRPNATFHHIKRLYDIWLNIQLGKYDQKH